jgi:hypothetical protein
MALHGIQPKKARLHQRITSELKLKLRAEAKRRHLDETSVVTIAIAEYFEHHGDPPAECYEGLDDAD